MRFLWLLSLLSLNVNAANYYGKALCIYPQYECIKITKKQSWDTLFPQANTRDIVQRINRTYNPLLPGKEIAVPRDLNNKTLMDFAPFPLHITPEGEKKVIVEQDKLAWGAYDINGQLVNWGPISSGRDQCSDSSKSCRTMTGIFYFFSKENAYCRSNVYPLGKGGAKMPYCMYFHKGFALHGANDIPGYRASHGCVRLFNQDAKWLNQQFVTIAAQQNNFSGTKIIVRPILQDNKNE